MSPTNLLGLIPHTLITSSPPYWLRQPRQGNRFSSPPDLAGQPFEPPLLLVRAHAVIDGAPVDLVRPVTARWADPRRGERRRELQVQPRLNAVLKPALTLLTPARHEPLRWAVTVENATPQPQTGEVGLRLAGAALGAGQTVTLAAGERRRVLLSAPAPAAGGVARLVWRTAADETPLSTVHDIDYDHLPPRQYLAPAEARLAAVDVAVDRTRAIGYVPGPGDGVPEALAELGLPVKPLDAGTLDEPGALDGLRTVVVGLRAYEVNDGLRRQNSRLLDWVRQGGTLVVLYQKTPYATPGLAPFPLTYAEPHDRVTDETAAVRLLQPEHPLLSRPNGITPADFTGWVQELGLYFAHTWDSAYQPLLASHDPGEPDRLGGLLVANCGQGAYVYCGYALFRQLPVGVPGAYRLLANLVAYGR